jgi:hypothetical protein
MDNYNDYVNLLSKVSVVKHPLEVSEPLVQQG